MQSNPHEDPLALKALQGAIYRDKILRSRALTTAQRLEEVFALSNHQVGMMHAGAMDRLGTTDEAEGWREVRRWFERLDAIREHGRFVREITLNS
ncbi:MAG: hypothetical protein NTV46_19870 [Verrucomicrobia bacterium]|nr:hypothetical protein [Verrucomicrobiota bacterium]